MGHAFIKGLTVVGQTLFFSAFDSETNVELWRSDGTPLGTRRVVDINPGLGHSYLDELTGMHGVLYFRAFHPDYGFELWRSDGHATGTQLVVDLQDRP